MKRISEDQLIQFAYDELTGAEHDQVSAFVARDPQAAAIVASYRAMRTDSVGLNQIPACELSSERLRDAIMATPAPKRAARPFWLWALPSAAAVAGAVWLATFTIQSVPAVKDGLVGNTTAPAVESPTPAPATETEVNPEVGLDTPDPAPLAKTETLNPAIGSARKADLRPKFVRRDRIRVASSSAARRPEPNLVTQASPKKFGPKATDAAFEANNTKPSTAEPDAPVTVAAAPVKSAPGRSTGEKVEVTAMDVSARGGYGGTFARPQNLSVVIIQTTSSADTGARVATEVASTENVVVGG